MVLWGRGDSTPTERKLMPQTKDYVAHKHHLGRTLYHASVWWDDLGDRTEHPEPEWADAVNGQRYFPNLGLAKKWCSDAITKIGDRYETGYLFDVRIERGEWQPCHFDDGEYGHVSDAEFETDERWYCTGHYGDDLALDWDIEDYSLVASR